MAAIQNKVGQFLSASIIRNIVAQVKSSIDIRDIMDSQKIFLVNLSKGRIGEDNSRLLGGMIVTKIQLSAMERVDIPEKTRKDFYLYVDEFQNFATESFANILSEARKYRLNLVMAHQYTGQLIDKGNTQVLDAVMGNVGSILAFRVGAPDAEILEKEFMPRFMVEDLINLPKHQIYLKLMIDGVTSEAFSALTLPPIAARTESEEKVVRVSRERYGGVREEIERKIAKWSGMGDDLNIEEMIEEAKAKARGGQVKKKHKYKCSHCAKDMSLPVELDRARPVYCEECRPTVSELKKTGKYDPRQDLIYNEDLSVAGSVAELGSDGSWAKRKEEAGNNNGDRGESMEGRKAVEAPAQDSVATTDKTKTMSLLTVTDAVKQSNPSGNPERERKRRRHRKSKAGGTANAPQTIVAPIQSTTNSAEEQKKTALKPGEIQTFGDSA
ncbi:MAG: type IV secretory system conjugative DNA transfer family protein [Patescibacteria group bacterium]